MSLHLAGQAERPNPKLLPRGEKRSPLKYVGNVLLSDSKYFSEKSLASQLKFEFMFLEDQNSCREVKLFVQKVSKSAAM